MMRREVKSFVLRSGRMSDRQRLGLTKHLSLFEVSYDTPWSLEEMFGRQAPTVVEIGFGMGASLLETAKAAPDWNFIGIEVHRPGVGRLASDLYDENIKNVKLVCGDACEVFKRAILPQSLAGIQIFFPDPWPKKRHHKRRLIQVPFIQQLVHTLIPGGFLHCATDWEPYATHMNDVFSQIPQLIVSSESILKPAHLRRPLTKFEKRGIQFGHNVFDMIYSRQN